MSLWNVGRVEEYHCAGASLAIGVWLLLPLHTFANPAYRVMAWLAPESVWGLLLFFFGMAHLLVVRQGNPHRRMVFAFGGVLKWTALTVLIGWGFPASIGVPVFSTFAFANAISYIQLLRFSG